MSSYRYYTLIYNLTLSNLTLYNNYALHLIMQCSHKLGLDNLFLYAKATLPLEWLFEINETKRTI